MKIRYIIVLFVFLTNGIFAFSNVKHDRDISYSGSSKERRNLLDIFYPVNTVTPKDVIVFIHGGSWNSGKKDIYWWLGKNFAKKNLVAVTINYSLSPGYKYEQMATDCASALKWVKNNISKYGGNGARIFVMGHSAGGHLATLIDSDPRFFSELGIENPIKGVILNDGFGLDMNEYLLQAEKNNQTKSFLYTFSNLPDNWIKASPITYFDNIKNPYLIFVGEKTYPSIKLQSKRFSDMLINAKKPVEYQVIRKKKHIGMIIQMISKGNSLYDTILNFMQSNAFDEKA